MERDKKEKIMYKKMKTGKFCRELAGFCHVLMRKMRRR